MARLDDHPSVRAVRSRAAANHAQNGAPPTLDARELRAICLDAGADDVGFVALDRAELDDQRDDILKFFPPAKTLVSLVGRMNREQVRSPARSLSNLEFHAAGDHVNEAARRIAARLAERGVRAVNPPIGFPMEMSEFPGKVWVVSHKPVAVAAGLGQMGLHRNVIHPKFGSFIILGTLLVDAAVDQQSRPIEYNPCVDCKLCVAACPVGAIAEGGFNFSACYTHNYREFMGGFTDWVESIAASRSAADYRRRVSDPETASMWQSLGFGPNYKAAYCLSVCPAGEDVLAPFLDNRGAFVRDVVKPLQQRVETIYVQRGTDAEEYVPRRFPHKRVKRVGGVLRPTTIRGFIAGMQHAFQPGRAKGVNAVYHFRFTGDEPAECTVTIRDQKVEVRDGLVGECRLCVTASSRAWLRFLRKEAGIAWLLLTLQVRLKGDPRLLLAFGRCFPA